MNPFYFDVLGIEKAKSVEDIEAAYKAVVSQDPKSKDDQKILEAYNFLKDKKNLKQYNAYTMTHFYALRVMPTQNVKDIRSAYKIAASIYCTKFRDKKSAERFRQISKAYRFLSNEEHLKAYYSDITAGLRPREAPDSSKIKVFIPVFIRGKKSEEGRKLEANATDPKSTQSADWMHFSQFPTNYELESFDFNKFFKSLELRLNAFLQKEENKVFLLSQTEYVHFIQKHSSLYSSGICLLETYLDSEYVGDLPIEDKLQDELVEELQSGNLESCNIMLSNAFLLFRKSAKISKDDFVALHVVDNRTGLDFPKKIDGYVKPHSTINENVKTARNILKYLEVNSDHGITGEGVAAIKDWVLGHEKTIAQSPQKFLIMLQYAQPKEQSSREESPKTSPKSGFFDSKKKKGKAKVRQLLAEVEEKSEVSFRQAVENAETLSDIQTWLDEKAPKTQATSGPSTSRGY